MVTIEVLLAQSVTAVAAVANGGLLTTLTGLHSTAGWARTSNLRLRSPALFRLSYDRIFLFHHAVFIGDIPDRARTCNPDLRRVVLFQLSYENVSAPDGSRTHRISGLNGARLPIPSPGHIQFSVPRTGLEPATV
jgi:hypothetical protein